MALKEQIQNDMKAALLGGDRFVGDTLRNLKAAILNEEVAQNKRDTGISDPEIEVIIAREVKKRNESIVLYEQNGRPELAEEERKEAAVLATYLPQQLSEDQIRELAKTVIEAMENVGPSVMGQVIGGVKAKAGTSADGATVARIVKELLNS
ncbi:GatB/YqeY [Candidatus Saccharibacteria bacterium RIFCSPHIGHO2_01_FULL_45_15]|nr:MAG: GatB/YqeY [Candidatus Saccharibacteria bacterium RIFCSPHIGHO2_01_FULL_45_15]OGL27685.1 MAG: GatB/YqeY [Candidatus Saccharibacteria bacterium RIFCSPHIGHO2_02_FULL_46_12]OGL32065.1 MAG: GatB/YqeY [Candidatus Saccharibacteria bacterium RIFCSPHIGHO2_12_FULL_44_22]